MFQPLAGVTVISLEQAIAAPFASRQLADLGARVIKIERPVHGDFARNYDTRAQGMSSHFVWTNRNKESLALDIKAEGSQEILDDLLAGADVFLQNLAPGATARLGLDFQTLHERHPRLIVCDISGYGKDGPYRENKAYDLMIQSESGLLSTTGTADEMAKSGISISDIAAGMYAYTNILASLIDREKTGLGRNIDISMLESTVEWMGYPLYYTHDGQSAPTRAGAHHATIFPYGPYDASDGRTVMLGVQNEREWVRFCADVLRRPELADDEKFANNASRHRHRDELGDIIRPLLAGISSVELVRRLENAKIANARVNTMADVWDHQQLQARSRWSSVETPAGSIPALAPPGTLPGETRMGRVPEVGQDTEAILAELGRVMVGNEA